MAEIYGPSQEARHAFARKVIGIFRQTPGVADVDWYIEADQPKINFVIDKVKAGLHGISAETISQTLRIAVGGDNVALLHDPGEKEDVNIVLRLPLASRSAPEACSGYGYAQAMRTRSRSRVEALRPRSYHCASSSPSSARLPTKAFTTRTSCP